MGNKTEESHPTHRRLKENKYILNVLLLFINYYLTKDITQKCVQNYC